MNRSPRLLLEWEPRWRAFFTSIGPALAPRGRHPAGKDALRLLVPWEPRWHGFQTALSPALRRSARPLEGECPVGMNSGRGAGASLLAHLALIAALVYLSGQIGRPAQTAYLLPQPQYEVIYYSAPNLPQTEDAGGAEAGREGRAGGNEAHHPTQVIHIARGDRLAESVVDAPRLNLPSTDDAANMLAFTPPQPVAPAVEPQPSMSKLPPLSMTVVPPSPTVERSRMPVAPQYGVAVVAPAPAVPQRRLGVLPRASAQVVPPPVSAPPRDTLAEARLTLPAPEIVPPPPANFARDVKSMAGTAARVAGTDVVPPPPNAGGRRLSARLRSGYGTAADVVPPAPVAGPAGLRANASGKSVFGNTTDVAPPSPSVNNRELARGGKSDRSLGGGAAGAPGFVISLKPGGSVGVPANGGSGSLAMSPNGSGNNGLGGSGGGTGTGAGTGSGSGANGNGPGAASAGNGHGADPFAHGGTSASPGPGGSGLGGDHNGGIAGVTIRGGIVTLPSFGTPAPPDVPARSADPRTQAPDLTVVATSRSGGALSEYGVLKGSKVYTIYLDTRLGPAVLEYAEHRDHEQEFEADLTAPEAINTSLPSALAKARFVVSCVIDQSGLLKDLRVLNNAGAQTSAILAAIRNWRFRPVLRGQQAVAVDAILGFAVDTR